MVEKQAAIKKLKKTTTTLKSHQEDSKKVEKKTTVAKGKSTESDKIISAKPASSMEELMAQKKGELSVPKRGGRLSGIVTEITNRMVLVDIGAKTEGMIVDKEFEEARDFVKSLSVGDRVDVYILTPENDRGQILLSLREAAHQWQWKQLSEWMRVGEVVEVRGLDVNKGGLVARIDRMSGIQGFIPASQLGGTLAVNLDDLINKVFKAKIIEVDPKNNRLIFSEKYVSEAGEIEARKEALAHLSAGMKLKGTVVGLTDFGAFVRVNVEGKDVEGLVHISELSWEKIDQASLVVKEGDEVNVLVIDVHPETGKVGFSVKQLLSDPWSDIESRYPAGKKVAGTVIKVASFGAIVQLEPGVSGLLHISKIPTAKEPAVGETVEVVVEDLDPEHRKLALGMAMEEVPVIYR